MGNEFTYELLGSATAAGRPDDRTERSKCLLAKLQHGAAKDGQLWVAVIGLEKMRQPVSEFSHSSRASFGVSSSVWAQLQKANSLLTTPNPACMRFHNTRLHPLHILIGKALNAQTFQGIRAVRSCDHSRQVAFPQSNGRPH